MRFEVGDARKLMAIELARENNLLMLRTKNYMYSSCGKLYALEIQGIDERKL